MTLLIFLALCTVFVQLILAANLPNRGVVKEATYDLKATKDRLLAERLERWLVDWMELKSANKDGEQRDEMPEVGVREEDKQLILQMHNDYRAGVSPTAKNMMKMYWSEDIARHAQEYADSCPDGHDTAAQRKEGAGLGASVGQNLAWGYQSWPEAIDGWYNEVDNFKMGQGSFNGGQVGHYTQLVRDHATHIGCGFKNCAGKSMPTHYVCNYLYAQSDFENPYHAGSSCAECSGHCQGKLCDCGETICQNGGSMDPGSCSCKCEEPYTGSQCADTNCPASDPSYCGQPQPYGYEKMHCTMFTNVPAECPRMCGVC